MHLSEEPKFEISSESRQVAEELFEAITGLVDPEEVVDTLVGCITRILRRGEQSTQAIIKNCAGQIFGTSKSKSDEEILNRGAYIEEGTKTEFAADVIALADALFFNPTNTDETCLALQTLMREAVQEDASLLNMDFIESKIATLPDRCQRYAWLLILGQSSSREITQALIYELGLTGRDEELTEYLITRCVLSQCENRIDDMGSALHSVKKLRTTLKQRKRADVVLPLTHGLFERLSALPSESEQP